MSVYTKQFFQAEDGIRDVERSRGLGDVYKRQGSTRRSARHSRCRLDFFQAEDGIRDVERSRGLGDVYKRQIFYPFILRYSLFESDGCRIIYLFS